MNYWLRDGSCDWWIVKLFGFPGWVIGWLLACLQGWLFVRLVVWLFYWFIVWLFGCLVLWLNVSLFHWFCLIVCLIVGLCDLLRFGLVFRFVGWQCVVRKVG